MIFVYLLYQANDLHIILVGLFLSQICIIMNKKLQNLPNYLTTFRICAIPVIIITFYFDDRIFAHRIGAFLFLLAAITDFFDGYLARKYNLETNLGRMLDPIADKLLVGAVLMMIVKFNKANEIPCILILMREIFIAGLREFLAELHVRVSVSKLAQAKTFMQMAALFLMLLGSVGSGIYWLDDFAHYVLWAAAILTLVTGYHYFRASLRYF